MLKSYLLVGLRNSVRNRTNSLINIAGLSLALGCAITTFIFVDNQLNADNFHTKRDRIYQVTNRIEGDGKLEDWGDSPIVLGPILAAEQSSVQSFARIEFAGGAVRHNETVFNENIWFVDKQFMEIFDFPVLKGNRNTLTNSSEIILTKEIAEKYFGADDPVGQSISIKFNEQHKEEFIVGAVMERPATSSLYPEILLSMQKFEDLKFKDNYDWSYLTDATFVLLKSSVSISDLSDGMEKYKKLQNASSPQWQIVDFQFHSLKGLNLKGNSIISAVSFGAHPVGLIALSVVSGLLLLLASFNYMNISIATVATRLKEIGIRKVIGGKKKEIVQQFLVENFLLCTIAMVVGVLLSYLFFLPGFNTLYPLNVPFAFSSGNTIFLFFSGLLLFIGFISGAYPSLYIASFTPIVILRGREKFGQRSLLSRILLTLQFVLAFTTIVASFVFIDNSLYLKNKDWGYDHSQIITMDVGDMEKYLAMRDRFVNDNNIVSLAGSSNHIGLNNPHIILTYNEQQIDIIDFKVGYDYMETMNIRLKEGRFFERQKQSDQIESVVINEKFAERMNWDQPLDQTFELDSIKRYVIGVVENFHYDGFYNGLGPVIFRIVPEDNFRFLTVKIKPGALNATEANLRTVWSEVAPDDPYNGTIQDDVFVEFNRDNNANVKLLGFISSLTVVLASLGLFGLVSFNITRRMKEFSVRKVFGASLSHIFKLMNRDYLWILGVAFVIGAPLGFFLMNTLIQTIYPDPQSAGPIPFMIAIALMIVTVSITIGSQLRRITKESPGETLRND
jgi:ABC-type antimicrobial peptide transport system permease subunit